MSNKEFGREKSHAYGCRNSSLTTEYDPHTEMLTFQEKNSWERRAVRCSGAEAPWCLFAVSGQTKQPPASGGCLLSPQETWSLWVFQRPFLPCERQCACFQNRALQPQPLIRATWGACKNSNSKSTPRPVPSGLAVGSGRGGFENSPGDYNAQPQVGTAWCQKLATPYR